MPRRDGIPDDKKGSSLLDDRLDEVVRLKLVGATDHAIATQMEVARSTVTKFCAKPMVRKQIDMAQHDLVMSSVRQAVTGARAAINVFLRAVDPQSDTPQALQIQAAREIVRIVGVERMAASIDNAADAMRDGSARDALLEKARLHEQRVIDAQAVELPSGDGLRVVE